MIISPVIVPVEENNIARNRICCDLVVFFEISHGSLASGKTFRKSYFWQRKPRLCITPRHEHSAPGYTVKSKPLAVFCFIAVQWFFACANFFIGNSDNFAHIIFLFQDYFIVSPNQNREDKTTYNTQNSNFSSKHFLFDNYIFDGELHIGDILHESCSVCFFVVFQYIKYSVYFLA